MSKILATVPSMVLAAIVTLLLPNSASAHSDYWRCAAASGSPQAAIRNCGYRGYPAPYPGQYPGQYPRGGGWGPGRGYPGQFPGQFPGRFPGHRGPRW